LQIRDFSKDCTSPAGNEADIIFNTASNTIQYCDGANWRGIGK
jgi:hypothetical protein